MSIHLGFIVEVFIESVHADVCTDSGDHSQYKVKPVNVTCLQVGRAQSTNTQAGLR